MPKVSIIMPSLNVAKYIRPCMESVIKQTLQDIEILAVDAGSTDGTLEVLREYEVEYSRIKVLLSKKKSYGYQMNLGLEAAQGEYIGIVETDDEIFLDMYERLYAAASQHSLDYVKGYAVEFYDMRNGDRYSLDSVYPKCVETIVNPSEDPRLLKQDIFNWQGLYRSSFLRGIRFNETPGAAFQDQGFLLRTLGTAKRAMYLDIPVYLYRKSNLGASAYDAQGFRYIKEEYEQNEEFARALGERWEAAFWQRLFQQCLGRFEVMAYFDVSWDTLRDAMWPIHQKIEDAHKNSKMQDEEFHRELRLQLLLFLKDPRELFRFYQEEYKLKKGRMVNLLAWAEKRSVIIWGCGRWGKFAHAFLDKNGICVQAYVDKNADLWGKTVQGVPVISPERAEKDFKGVHYLVANKAHGYDICRELASWGIEESCIFAKEIAVDPLLLV